MERSRYLISHQKNIITIFYIATCHHHNSLYSIFELQIISNTISQLVTLIALDLTQVPHLELRPSILWSSAALSSITIIFRYIKVELPSELKIWFFHLKTSFWSRAEVTSFILMLLLPTRRAVFKNLKKERSDESKTNILIFSLTFLSMLRR